MRFFSYLFWPRPPQVGYDNPKLLIVLCVTLGLIVLSFALRVWRKRLANAQTKKLSRSWPTAAIWFGVTGLILAVSRAEDISYLSMRFLWVVWAAVFVLYVFIQVRMFRSKHYETIHTERVEDPREKYLPKRKKR